MKIKANGIQFNCRIEGNEGAPWLVFSNSLAGNLGQWDSQVPVFQHRFHILRYDQRGHGETEAPAGAYSFDTLTDDAIALLDAFKIDRAAFAGVSMGAVTGLRIACRDPQRLERVVAADGPWHSAASGSSAMWEERIAAVKAHGMEAMVEPTVRRWFRPGFIEADPPVLDRIRQMIRTTPAAGYIGCARALGNFDFREDFSSIRTPVLLVVGANDGTLPAAMREMHAAISGSQFVEIPDSGHLPNVEKPEAFNRVIDEFLR